MTRHKSKLIVIAVAVLMLAVSLIFVLRHWRGGDLDASRAQLLSLLPAEANAAGFLDLQQLRASPFLQQFLAWAPQVSPDSEYAQFLQATGFDYERDLDRVAVSWQQQAAMPWIFAVAEGRFDRKKIEAYGARFGSLKTADGKTLFAVPVSGSQRKAYFTFLRDDRVAWANDPAYFFQKSTSGSGQEWREHLLRVAGSPIFVVLQQDAVPASVLAQAPGGFRSPQLATLLRQLQWISISGKPEGSVLRVVVDGETNMENTAHQLKEMLSGLVVLAQVGLNDAKTRSQLDPELRRGYLDLLQSADIQQLDRGTSKSVRVILQVTAKVLQAPQTTPPPVADPPSPKPPHKKKAA